jgi:hypothetical protein
MIKNVLTPEYLARKAADSWRRQYHDSPYWNEPLTAFGGDFPPKRETYEKLVGLGDSPSARDVGSAIGNRSWTRTQCCNCKSEYVPVVLLGEAGDFGAPVSLCRECLLAGMAALDEWGGRR